MGTWTAVATHRGVPGAGLALVWVISMVGAADPGGPFGLRVARLTVTEPGAALVRCDWETCQPATALVERVEGEGRDLYRRGGEPVSPPHDAWILRRPGWTPALLNAVGQPPDLTYDPRLEGPCDIYLGIRAVTPSMSFGIRLGSESDFTIVTAPAASETRHFDVEFHWKIRADMTGETLVFRALGKPVYLQSLRFVPEVHRETTVRVPSERIVICREPGRHFAFPGVAELPNGDLAVVCREGVAHVCPFGRIVLVRSRDGGRTWDPRDVVRVLKNEPPPAMPQFLAHPVHDRATWEAFRSRLDPDTPGRLPVDLVETARRSPQRVTPLGAWLGGTFGYIRNWMGVERACLTFYDDPGLIDHMVSHLTHLHATLARRILAAGVQLDWVMFWEDMAYNHGSLISPGLYRRHCLPFYQVLVDLVRSHGVPVIGLDSDGNIEELLPLWLDAGIALMHPMEVAAGMDVRVARRRFGRNVTFLGGIDKRALAAGPRAIDAEVIPKVRSLQEAGGGVIVQCDHAVPPDVSLDNFRYFHERVRTLFEAP